MSALDEATAPEVRVAELEAQVAEQTARIEALEKPLSVTVGREPLTYDAHLVADRNGHRGFRAVPNGPNHSYCADQIAAWTRGDPAAKARLQRHGREMEVERERRRLNVPEGAAFEMAPERRAPTASYADPPRWMIEYFATAPRPGRVLAAEAPNFDLPLNVGSTVNVPRLTTGTRTAMTTPGAPVPGRDITDAVASSNICAIAGVLDVPLQMLEQSPVGAHFDWVAFTDLDASYNFQLEMALLNGTGQGSNLLGLLNNLPNPYVNNPTVVSAAPVNQVSPSSAATVMFTSLGQMIAAVGRNRLAPPTLWQMPTPRMAWIGASEDNQSRPLMIADKDGAGHFDLLTIEVILNDAIQPVYSSAGNPAGGEERIVLCRPEDWLIMESPAITQAMQNPLSGTLEVRLAYRRYAAAICRYPSSNAVLVGPTLIPGTLY